MMDVPSLSLKGNMELKIENSSIMTEMGRGRSFSLDGAPGQNFIDSSVHYKDWNASSMSVNRSGKLAVLAARKGFLIVDFDNHLNDRKVPCNFRWEPGPLEWNPHSSSEELFASVINTKVKVWNVKELPSDNPSFTFSSHTRTISDINWNNFDWYSLLTCSMDTYINMWDIRVNKKPASTFTTVAGSSQVKWNRKNKNLFASAHDGDVRIWDIRKGNIPAIYIAGHLSKIHGLDWSPQKESYFVTASNDSMVKFWNVNSPKQPRASFSNVAPVWKARYTPFGNGLVTVLVPQLRRSENSLFLWNTNEFKKPVEKFEGHNDVILEFQWRIHLQGDQDQYQLVSWSKDQHLRLWTVDKKAVQAINGEYNKSFSRVSSNLTSPLSPTAPFGDVLMSSKTNKHLHFDPFPIVPQHNISSTLKETRSLTEKLNRISPAPERPTNFPLQFIEPKPLVLLDTKPPFSPSGLDSAHSPPDRALSPLSGNITAFRKHESINVSAAMETSPIESAHLQTLKQEFALINHSDPFYKIEKMDAEHRVCSVFGKAGSILLKLQISFPLAYPDKVAPDFMFVNVSNIDPSFEAELMKAILDMANQHVKHNRPCLEPCLRQFRNYIENLRSADAIRSDDSLTPMTPPSNMIQSFTFKRVEPAADSSYQDSTVPFPRTCGARFCSAGDRLVVFSRSERFSGVTIPEKNLRSLSALYAYLQNLSTESSLDSSAFDESETSYKKPKSVVGLVYITDTSGLLPVSKYLAQNYVLNGDDPAKLCLKNAQIAQNIPSVQRKDLVQAWSLLSLVMSKQLTPTSFIKNTYIPPWPCHPFGRKLVNSLFKYYETVKDVQMLAVMSCILTKQSLPDEIRNMYPKSLPQPPEKIFDKKCKIPCSDSFPVSPEFQYNVYNKLSAGEDSWSPPTFVEEKVTDPMEEDRKRHRLDCRLLNPNEMYKYDQFKRYYGEILYRWNFITQFAEVTKYIARKSRQIEAVDLCLDCSSCKNSQREPYCVKCKSIIVKCSVCRIGVRGLLSFCITCGHGGHLYHLNEWFQNNDLCPSGCGHYCMGMGVKFVNE